MLIRRVLSLLVAVVLASPAYAIERQQHNRFAGLTVSGAALFANGTVGAPSIAFASDADGTGTGFYRAAANNPRLAINGVDFLSVAASGTFILAEEFYVPDGQNIAPSITFNNDTNTGIYRVGADEIGFSAGGAATFTVRSDRLAMAVGGTAAVPAITLNDADTGFYRVAADQLGVSAGGSKRVEVNTGGLDVTGELSVSGTTTASGVICVKADGDYGQCTSAVGAGGTCTCA